MQTTILMIRPVAFRNNDETAVNNYFQKKLGRTLPKTIQAKALKEFNNLVVKLEKIGLNVIVVDDTLKPDTPDSIFPNNWISFHEKGIVCVYPMFAKNRRLERREDVLEIVEKNGFKIKNIIDYTSAEEENLFLEGTGSMVLDRVNKIAYCALSPRSNEEIFIEFCEDLEYTPVVFRANQIIDGKRKSIYHTNVMMSVGKDFVIICLKTISDKKQRKHVADALTNSDKEIINITEEQVNNFAGNIIQLTSKDKKDYIVMSKNAHKSLSKAQIKIIEKHGKIISSDINTIETCGGGSLRCLITEIFN
jgi:hypothetical protein